MSARRKTVLKIAWKNIYLNWRHSMATMVAIMAGFSAVALFDGFMVSLKSHIDESYISRGMLGHLLIERIDTKYKLFEDPWLYSISKPEQEKVEKFLQDPRIKIWSRFLLITGLATNGKTNVVYGGIGYDIDTGTAMRGKKWSWNAVAGIPLHLAREPAVILGTGLAQRLECDFNEYPQLRKDRGYQEKELPFHCANPMLQLSATTEHAQVNAISVRAVGTQDLQLREFNDKFVALTLADAQKLEDTDRITRYSIQLNNGMDIASVRRDFDIFAKKENLPLEITPWYEHPVSETAKGGMEILRVFRMLFLGVVAIIAAMSVANSMMKSINERIREIGMLRSMGFQRRDIVWMFSAEGFFLGLLSCVAGMIFTFALSGVIAFVGIDFKAGVLSTPIPVTITPSVSGWIFIAAVLCIITTLVSWVVSRRAARMVVADALRYVA